MGLEVLSLHVAALSQLISQYHTLNNSNLIDVVDIAIYYLRSLPALVRLTCLTRFCPAHKHV